MSILVFIEQRDGAIKKPSYEAVRAAAGLAGDFGGEVTAVLFGADEAAAKSLAGYGATKVLQVADERLNLYSNSVYAKVLADVISAEGADVVLMSATAMGKDLAPRLAVRIEGAVAGYITSLAVVGG